METAKLTSLNEAKAKSFELTSSLAEVTIGRASENQMVIADQRCSSKHCKVTLGRNPDGQVELKVVDLSSNGTFVNGKRIAKQQAVTLDNGDIISVLKGATVPEADVIEFKVVLESAKRKRQDSEGSPTKKPKLDSEDPPTKKPALTSELSEDLCCGICMEVIHQCVTLMPCLHNFCGGCFSDWLNKSNLCPACRDPVNEVKRNAGLNNIIETYLKSHSEERRPLEELKELELKNKITQDTLTITNRKKSFDSAGSASSSSSEEEFKATPARRAATGRTTTRALRAPTPANLVKCRQCTRNVQGFKCTQAQVHVPCSQCSQIMPLRTGVVQTCEGCSRHFCNLYWRTNPRCTYGLMQLDSYRTSTFTSMPPSALSENQFEQNVLTDYLRAQRASFNDVLEAVLADLTAGRWTPRLYTRDVRLTRNSQICTGCAALLWNEMLYHYRNSISDQLPAYIRGRQPCWYGKDCKTQRHNISHAQKLNHVCAPDTSRQRR